MEFPDQEFEIIKKQLRYSASVVHHITATSPHLLPLRKQCLLKPAFRHTAGTCCTGHSLQGKQLRCEDVTVIYQVAFMALRDEMEEREVDQENVEFFPVAELMGRCLDIQIGKFV